jgi:2-keto-3-deoxy-L-fuconate dehydrogenase
MVPTNPNFTEYMSPYRLDDRCAIITGSGSGIGRQIAVCFARQGADVHLLDINETGARETVEQIRSGGGKASFHPCDVTRQDAVLEIVQTIQEKNPIRILVNNAGIAHIGKAHSTPESDFDRVFSVNVKGVYNCLFACLPHMQANGGGVILNMASVAATCGIADRFAYSSSKGAVYTMTLSVAKDYIQDNIRCNSISPARIHTPFVDGYLAKTYPGREQEMFDALSATQPIGRMGLPEEVAQLALFLCSDEAGFITGTDYPIDGGFLKLNT